MVIKTKFVFLISIIIILVSCVSAQFLMPHQFYGKATYNGVASEDIKVEAYYDGSVVKTIFSISDGFYNLKVGDPDENKEGKTIKFYLNDVDTGINYTFENGASTKLDLVASGPAISPPPNTNTNTGSSSSSSGGSSSSPPDKSDEQADIIIKTSSGENGEDGSDSEDSDLGILETEQEKSFLSGITGAVIDTLGKRGTVAVAFIIGVIAISVIVFIIRKRKATA